MSAGVAAYSRGGGAFRKPLARMSVRSLLQRLDHERGIYGHEAADDKLSFLAELATRELRSAAALRRFHQLLCYLVAFADHARVYRAAGDALDGFATRVSLLSAAERRMLDDSGIAGSSIRHPFSFQMAEWLARRCPGEVEIDWAEFEDPAKLDPLLSRLLFTCETDLFDSGEIGTAQWIRLARGAMPGTGFDWLFAQLHGRRSTGRCAARLYDAAEVPLRWRLGASRASKSLNRLPVGREIERRTALRRPVGSVQRLIQRPLHGIRRLPVSEAIPHIDVAMAALAVRQREVYSMNHANPEEVYATDCGRGVRIVLMGVVPEYRLSLEGNYGYILLANGIPVGYGGASPLFSQANTGINIFEEYRHSEAAFLFSQVLRTIRSLFGCSQFISNPYQFGGGNTEAVRSGAFWFYYRLGFRPVDPEIRRLARREFGRIRKGDRSPPGTLRELARCNMHLALKGARRDELFDEQWLTICSRASTEMLGARAGTGRRRRAAMIAERVARELGARQRSRWPAAERRAFDQLALVVGLFDDLNKWTATQKRNAIELMRAKGKPQERDYVRLLRKHACFRRSLSRLCRRRGD